MPNSNTDSPNNPIPGGRTVADTDKGKIEYQIVGNGPYILHSHGTPSDCAPSVIQQWLTDKGFGVISISRPGYGATPLATGASFADQADAIAALLDHLSIDRVAIYGVSGGGPTSIEFAARHPTRARALMLEVAISIKRIYPWYATMLLNSFFSWLIRGLSNKMPKLMIAELVKGESTLDKIDQERVTKAILDDPNKFRSFLDLILSQPPSATLRDGMKNDFEGFRELEKSPFGMVRCPTFVAHGTHDADVPFIHAETSAQEIQGAELFTVDKGFHMLALGDHAEELRSAQIDFFRRHLE